MKQGSGKTVADYKTEPKAHAVNVAAVAQMGVMLGNHATEGVMKLHGASVPLYRGRGLEAPMVSETSHPRGSQGRHK